MGKVFSAFGVAGGLFVGACNTCSNGHSFTNQPQIIQHQKPDTLEDIIKPQEDFSSTPKAKDDWNGLRIRMTEGQVRTTLKNLGFKVVPGRNRQILKYDEIRSLIHIWNIKDPVPLLVFMETEREKKVLPNVWGVELAFFRGRLVQFSPQYFTGPVELVDPDDEYVTAKDMHEKMLESFGTPNIFDEELDVVYPHGRGKRKEKTCVWTIGGTNITFRISNDKGITRYYIVFSNIEAIEEIESIITKSLKSKNKKSEPSEIVL